MKKFLVVGIAAVAFCGAPAHAAAPYDFWTGFYVGVNIGGAFGTTAASETGLPLGNPGASNDYNLDHKLTGWLAGGQIGYNWQMDQWVLGFEADIASANISGDGRLTGTGVTTRNGAGGGAGNFVFADEKISWFGTARVRAGWLAAPTLMLYATAGAAFGQISYDGQFHYILPADYIGSASATKLGWIVGAGFEYRFAAQWSAKAEYLYYDLGNTSFVTTTNFNPASPSIFDYNTHGSIVRVGLNFRFASH